MTQRPTFSAISPLLPCALLGVLSLVAGCQSFEQAADPGPVEPAGREVSTPTYEQVREKYNARAGKVERLWSRAIIEMNFTDDKGKERFEQGEGHLILVQPEWISLSMGKLGNTLLWAGRDPVRYWLFFMGDESRVYVGAAGRMEQARKRINLPVSLDQLLMLSGLQELPEMTEETSASVALEGQFLRVSLPGDRVDMLVDPTTWLPVQIRAYRAGQVEMLSTLSKPESVVLDGVAPGAYPLIQSHVVITYPGKPDRLALFLSAMTDGQEDEKIKPGVFDYDRLLKVLKPARVIQIDE